jgi:hypothetical protein
MQKSTVHHVLVLGDRDFWGRAVEQILLDGQGHHRLVKGPSQAPSPKVTLLIESSLALYAATLFLDNEVVYVGNGHDLKVLVVQEVACLVAPLLTERLVLVSASGGHLGSHAIGVRVDDLKAVDLQSFD